MNFFSYCEDEQIKIKIDGMPVHKFFASEGFLIWGLEPNLGNYDGYAQIVDMPIDEFIGLAEPIPKDDEKRHAPLEQFKKDVLEGNKTDWDIPYLVLKENEDGIWKVVGHDGRHRGKLLKSIGYEEMPVLLQLPDAELNEELLPDVLWCQNDKSIDREKYFYDFPITEDNFKKPYVEMGDGVVVIGRDGKGINISMDEDIYPDQCNSKKFLKDYMGEVKSEDRLDGRTFSTLGKAPDSCEEAKKNFAKNFVPNVMYREDNTMPARNLKEYLEKKGK